MPLYVHTTLTGASFVYDQDLTNGRDSFKEIRFKAKKNRFNQKVFGVFSTKDARQIEFIESTDDFKNGLIQKAEGDDESAFMGRDSFVKCPFCDSPCRTPADLAKHCSDKHSTKETNSELRTATEGSQRQTTQSSGKR